MQDKEIIEKLLKKADLEIGRDIKINNENLYKRVLEEGSIGLGEAYMDGWWSADNLVEFFFKALKADLQEDINNNWELFLKLIVKIIFNQQTKDRAFKVGEKHYDIGNDLYKVMLDKRMVYTCGYWKNVRSLNKAQEAKLDLVCRKLDLQPGQKILDIGCGWGSFMKYAAQKYGVSAVGLTVSQQQVDLGNKLCAGWPVEIRFQDYREVEGVYDHIVSLGMFEHVGYRNYRIYLEVVEKHLSSKGLFLLHTIGSNRSVRMTDPWIEKYIFPNSMIPSIKQIGAAAEELFVMEDWHNFSVDYYRTLMAWFKNFDRNWDSIKSKYDKRFYRMWKYYLLSSAASFKARKTQLWQIVFSKQGIPGGYESVR